MSDLYISQDVSLPIGAVTEAVAIVGRRGTGKTNTAVVIVEEMLKAHQQVCVLDPVGVWYGLRSSADGTVGGLPILILGGLHGDLPLGPTQGAAVAHMIVDRTVSVVLDVSEFSNNQQVKFITEFGETLYARKSAVRSPMHLVLDEADAFVPQQPMPDERRMLGAMDKIVRRGRVRGLGITLIGQRPAVINKNVLSQTEVLITMQMTGPQDIKAIDDWVSSQGTADQRRELLDSITKLPTGTGWVVSPRWLAIFKQVAFRERFTFDSSATPEVGAAVKEVARVSLAGLEDIRLHLAESEGEEELPKDAAGLKAKIADLQRQLKESLSTVQAPVQVEVPVIAEEEWEALCHIESQLKDANELFASIVNGIASMRGLQHPEAQVVEPGQPLVTSAPAQIAPATWDDSELANKSASARAIKKATTVEDIQQIGATVKAVKESFDKHFAAPTPSPTTQRPNHPTTSAPKAGARKMLDILARHHPMKMTRAQLATFAGYAKSGGTYKTYLSKLRTEGFTQDIGGYISLTKEGLAAAGVAPNKKPMTTDDVLAIWRRALKAGARKMLDIIVAAYPAPVERKQLARAMGMEATGGTFKTYVSHLKVNGLATTSPNAIRASDSIFIGGKK